MADSFDSGPLPKAVRSDELEDCGRMALECALPSNLFHLHRVSKDKGVDGRLEIKSNGSYTNVCADFQLKSTDHPRLNQDGSASLEIETRNLQYLLNGRCPLYFLWIAPTSEIRFAWATGERKRIETDNPAWTSQGTVTLRLVEILTAHTVPEIYERIRQEGQLHRQIRDTVARTALAERVVIGIDPHTLEATDPDEIGNALRDSGLSLVGNGKAQWVIDHVGLVRQTMGQNPRIQLVHGYAMYFFGRYKEADGHLAQAARFQTDLSDDDRHFLAALRNICDYQTGRISRDQFLDRERLLAREAPPRLARQHRFEAFWHALWQNTGPVQHEQAVRDFTDVSSAILADPKESPALRISVQIRSLQLRGFAVNKQFMDGMTRIQMRAAMKLELDPGVIRAIFEERRRAWERLDREFEGARQAAERLSQPLLAATARVTKAAVNLMSILDMESTLPMSADRQLPASRDRVLEALRVEVQTAVEVFHQADHLENELWGMLVLADIHDVAGRPEEGKSIARSVLGPAQALGYRRLECWAEDHLAGQSHNQQLQAIISRAKTMDIDLSMAAEGDESIRRFAEANRAALGLPRHRLPVIERECLAMRAAARERVYWCQHLQLLNDKSHELSADTHYRDDPNREWVCTKHNHHTLVETPEWEPLLTSFKGMYCHECPDRQPKIVASV
jgi:hypothetical protein